MAFVNKVILVGNCGAAPELRYSAAGSPIATVSIATTETWTDRASGEKREVTDWHKLAFFGKLAEEVARMAQKGTSIYVEGRLKNTKWKNKHGEPQVGTQVECDEMQVVSRPASQPTPIDARPPSLKAKDAVKAAPTPPPPPAPAGDGYGNDIPFAPRAAGRFDHCA